MVQIYVHGFLNCKPLLILAWEFTLVLIVPSAYYVRRGQSKPRLIFSRINGPNDRIDAGIGSSKHEFLHAKDDLRKSTWDNDENSKNVISALHTSVELNTRLVNRSQLRSN